MKKAFIFDRDGTINHSPGPGYVLKWEDFYFTEGAVDLLRWLKADGWALVLVTSQKCVGKELISKANLEAIHDRMQEQLRLRGAAFDRVYAATSADPNDPERKPEPTLILRAQAELGFDLSASWNVGDKERDMVMGRRAGVGMNVQIGTGAGAQWEVESLTQLHQQLRRWRRLVD